MREVIIITPEQPIQIERLTPTGEGIGTVKTGDEAGKKGFFWNALPGELVTKYELVKNHNKFFEAIAIDIENPNKDRVEPKDKHFLSTSPWQILNETAEAEAKIAILKEIYRDFDLQDIPFTDSPKPYAYRNKMEYALYYNHDDEKIHLAAHKRGSHGKVMIESSSIEIPAIYERALAIVDELNKKHDEARRYQSLLLRSDQHGKVSGGLYENHKPHPTFEPLEDELLGYKYSYSPNGFFQINLPVYEAALKRIKSLLTETKKVLDLYSGVGTIGLSVARDKDLTLVELDHSAYRELEANAENARKTNPNIKTVLARSEEALEYITPDSVVILDPPRSGCHDALIEKLLEVHPKEIIYLSCNPMTQARDVAKLTAKYSLKTIEGFNFFPHTPHIECLISLS